MTAFGTTTLFTPLSPINCGITPPAARRLTAAAAAAVVEERWLALGYVARESVQARRRLGASSESSTFGTQIIVPASNAVSTADALRSNSSILTNSSLTSYALLANVSVSDVQQNVSNVAPPVPVTPSVSASATQTPSITESQSPLASVAETETPSPSVAESVKPSSPSPSVSPSASASGVTSPSQTSSLSPSQSAYPPAAIVLSTTTIFSLPAGTSAALACSSGPQTAVAQTVVTAASAGISVDSIVSTATTCTAAGARRELAADGARRLATSASITVTLALLNSAAAQAAYTALLTLNTGSFATTIAALVAAAGPGAYTTNAVTTTAACGNGACSLPQGSTSGSSPAVNVGAVVGGVIGGFAALVIFVAAVLYVRHQKIKVLPKSFEDTHLGP